MNDNEILAALAARDESALAALDASCGRLCRAIARNILGSEEDAEECVNDTWLKSWNAMPPERPGNLRAFFCRITRNLSIDRYRARHKTKSRGDGFEVALHELTECLPDPATVQDNDPLPALLDEFLDSLKPTPRKLLVGRYWHAYSVNQLAETYGMTPNHVSVTLKRLREALRDFLTERGYRI